MIIFELLEEYGRKSIIQPCLTFFAIKAFDEKLRAANCNFGINRLWQICFIVTKESFCTKMYRNMQK